MPSDDPMIAALLRERDGYLRSGRKERAALVDEQLALRGYQAKSEPVEKSEPDKAPRGRQAPPKRTAS